MCVDLSPQAVHASLSKFRTLGVVAMQSTVRPDGTVAQYAFCTKTTYENCLEVRDFFYHLISEHYYNKYFSLFSSKGTKRAYKQLLHINNTTDVKTTYKQKVLKFLKWLVSCHR